MRKEGDSACQSAHVHPAPRGASGSRELAAGLGRGMGRSTPFEAVSKCPRLDLLNRESTALAEAAGGRRVCLGSDAPFDESRSSGLSARRSRVSPSGPSPDPLHQDLCLEKALPEIQMHIKV